MKINHAVLSSLLLLLFGLRAEAAVYTVKGAGGGSFTTIQACSNSAVAGDTCDVFAGSYSGWTQNTSGSAGSPITFTAHTGNTVTVTGNVTISSRSYLTISYLRFSGSTARITGNGTTTHNVIDHNTFTGATKAFNLPDGLGHGASDNVFSNNTVTIASLTGTAPLLYVYGDRNRIESNEIHGGGGDCMEVGGINVVIRNNYCHDFDGSVSGEHVDGVQVIGGVEPTLSFSVIEGNVFKNCAVNSQCHVLIIRAGTGGDGEVADTVITRYNYAYNWKGIGLWYADHTDPTGGVPNGYVYNNTIALEVANASHGNGVWFDTNGNNGKAFNNIFYNTQNGGVSPMNQAGTITANGDIAFVSGYSGTWDGPYSSEATYTALRNQNPLFLNYPTDASIGNNSPAYNTGVALTTVAAGDSGSGTSLVLNDAHGFQPGWAGTQGDWIRVGASTTAQIRSINYATNTLTLASAITRSTGAPVYLYKNSSGTVVLFGSLPTVGAFPAGSGSAPTAPTGLSIE